MITGTPHIKRHASMKLQGYFTYNTAEVPIPHAHATPNSTSGYLKEILALQHLAFPPKSIQEMMGMLSYQCIGCPQVQCEGGVTILSPRGMRIIHTFRKLPAIAPYTNDTNISKSFISKLS